MVVRPIEKSSQIRTGVTERVKEQGTTRIWLMRDLRRFSPSFPESHRFSIPVSLGGSKESSSAAKLLTFLSTHPVKMPEVVCICESRHHIHLPLLHPFPSIGRSKVCCFITILKHERCRKEIPHLFLGYFANIGPLLEVNSINKCI